MHTHCFDIQSVFTIGHFLPPRTSLSSFLKNTLPTFSAGCVSFMCNQNKSWHEVCQRLFSAPLQPVSIVLLCWTEHTPSHACLQPWDPHLVCQSPPPPPPIRMNHSHKLPVFLIQAVKKANVGKRLLLHNRNQFCIAGLALNERKIWCYRLDCPVLNNYPNILLQNKQCA